MPRRKSATQIYPLLKTFGGTSLRTRCILAGASRSHSNDFSVFLTREAALYYRGFVRNLNWAGHPLFLNTLRTAFGSGGEGLRACELNAHYGFACFYSLRR